MRKGETVVISQNRVRHGGWVLLLLAGSALVAASCGEVSRTGRSPAFLVIDALTATAGQSGGYGQTLQSDVLTCGSPFEDLGQAQVRVLLRDEGAPGAPTGFSNLNWLKIDRYRVVFRRADGRNRPGVDVPYPFDGALSATITNTPTTVGFTMVRVQAKIEPPLSALLSGGGAIAISTIAEVTFYGEDLAGNGFVTSGSMSINFADWGDPSCSGS